ncbi:MAG: acetyltransferase [Sulfuricurvum sp.]|nr:acetyltransferase [Sulfuricurvum sp.]
MAHTKEIYIYGNSGHGKVVADIALSCGYNVAGWIDDNPLNDSPDWETFIQTHTSCTIALGIGNNHIRFEIAQKIGEYGHQLPILIHPSAIVSPSARIASGTVVMPLSVINADAIIGAGVIVNSGAVIEHDCIIEDYAHISPNASLAGNVKIGKFSLIGIGTSVVQNIVIGEGSVIGAGSAVIGNIPDNCTAVGVPSKIIHSNNNHH